MRAFTPEIWIDETHATITAFGSASPPAVQPAPLPPTEDPAALAAQQAAAEAARTAGNAGRASTILTGPQGITGDTTGGTSSAAKKLLGA